MKTPRLHYFKKNTIELPEGYRKPIKRKRKTAVEPPPIIVAKAKPVIRRRTPRGRLMPLRMKNEFIPPGADWCQINGQKVRQDIYFGDVRGRMFIPGRWTGEGCGPCGPSMFDFGGGCGDDGGGDGGCAGCDSGCDSAGCDSGCESTGCAVDGCAGCASCAETGCESTGCAETGCTTTSDTGCTSTGCAETGCTTTSDTGCTSTGCAETGCSSVGCAETGCSIGCADPSGWDTGPPGDPGGCGWSLSPTSDFGGCAVDFTGGGQGFGFGPAAGGNLGYGNAIGAPGWATGDFGTYGYGGPTGTGFGYGAQGATIGGPGMYGSPAGPGITGFANDFNAPPGATFGMPNSQDVGPQTGPGMIGGPSTSQPGEALFGPGMQNAPAVDPNPTVNPDDRTENPTSVFGPEFASTQAGPAVGNFGFIGQAQAASRGSDELAAALQSSPFAQVEAMAAQLAQSNPQLAEALMGIVANQNTQTNMIGPTMTGFEQATPGAQQGFTGVGPTASQQGAFSGQNTLSGVSGFTNDQAQGKGDLGARGPAEQANPNMDLIGPMTTQQGYNQLAAEMNAQQTQQQGYQTLAEQMNAQQNQQAMVEAQERGEQARGPQEQEQSPQQTISNAFNDLAGRGPGLTQTDFDSRFGTPDMFAPTYDLTQTPPAPTQVDPFGSRFGDFRSNEEQQQQLEQLSTNFGPNYGPQAPGLAEPGQLGRGFELADPNVTPGQTNFGQNPLGTQFSAPTASRGPEVETLGPQIGPLISALDPASRGVGREAAPLGLWGMQQQDVSRGSPTGMPSQAGPFGRGSESSGRGPESGRGPGLSITVGANPQSSGRGPSGGPGYYSTGGLGIAPGARGAEFGGVYGPGVATGMPGTNTFGVSGREGAAGFYDAVTGVYYR